MLPASAGNMPTLICADKARDAATSLFAQRDSQQGFREHSAMRLTASTFATVGVE